MSGIRDGESKLAYAPGALARRKAREFVPAGTNWTLQVGQTHRLNRECRVGQNTRCKKFAMNGFTVRSNGRAT